MFAETVDRVFAALWALQPGWAVYLGKHEYDGLAPDWSIGAVEAQLAALAEARTTLASADDLGQHDALDRELLISQIDKTRFEWDVLRLAERNPMPWVYLLDPDLYMRRRYADDATRARAATRLLEHAGSMLATARQRLDETLDSTICAWGITAADGLADMIRTEVNDAFDLDGVTVGRSALRGLVDRGGCAHRVRTVARDRAAGVIDRVFCDRGPPDGSAPRAQRDDRDAARRDARPRRA